MEENDQSNRDVERQDSGDESNRAILPLLQAPGNLLPHRITNFYIDNILRPDFGRRKEGTRRDEINIVERENRCPSAPGSGQVGAPVSGEGTSSPHPVSASKKTDITADASLKARAETVDQCLSSDSDCSQSNARQTNKPMLWPAWVYCTRYSDRPSSGKNIFYYLFFVQSYFYVAYSKSAHLFCLESEQITIKKSFVCKLLQTFCRLKWGT